MNKKTVEKKVYNAPKMKVVKLKQKTNLLQCSDNPSECLTGETD